MKPKGSALLKKEFIHTTLWPNPIPTSDGMLDLEKIYKEALSGSMVTVMDIAVDGNSYLVLSQTKEAGAFIWMIDKGDTIGFIPLIKANGIVMPAGMSIMEKMEFMTKNMKNDYKF